MGAPKQKWTSEEEAALKAGVAKYGVGKWSTIIKDPEFSDILRSRSNVDLKDKWRNLHVMACGWGSRQPGRIGYKSIQPTVKHVDNALEISTVVENGIEVLDASPLASSNEKLEDVGSKEPISRLDDLILEVIAGLKEPRGCSRTTISSYLEEHFMAPPDFEKLLVANLKALVENGRLIKVKHQYRITPSRVSSCVGGNDFPLFLEGKQKDSPKLNNNGVRILTKAQIDAELAQMMSLSAEEIAAAAAQAVADAEADIAEAERAARDAEEAEAEAEAAQCFAEAALKALNPRTLRVW
ncbi:telomere repeat-binding factor 1-like isoform X1 [Lycium ferocissimum]|uniref:telomere repeat-binding factor 1-like isoform X1 n=1 Tax=Lycium ferocissimum TaxID=112874 RepID=UPI0028155603|nr:telomere repeat-binding factor 1-like isoform X1 [Lycium ferocissimum]XP_059293502.1 telomere repeat-binding factor 1-like isoform X1 [Lycium ferocissimum]XP_059293503.1 telomere repeat-binding factor 1-like isoform X1 [Lycium ferocissimum]